MAAPRRRHARLGSRGVALVTYFAVTTFLPVLHVGSEVLRSEASVEAGHTQACPVLHGGDECTVATWVQHALFAQTPVQVGLSLQASAVGPPHATSDTARHRVRQNAVRAPPMV